MIIGIDMTTGNRTVRVRRSDENLDQLSTAYTGGFRFISGESKT